VFGVKTVSKRKVDFSALKERFEALRKKWFQSPSEKLLQDLLKLELDDPNDLRYKQRLAEAYYRLDRIDEAVSKYAEIAAAHEKQDFNLKAIKVYKSILKIKPQLIDINLRLAQLFAKVGLMGESANQFRIAVNHFAIRGDGEKTVALSQQLVKIDPSNTNRHKLAEIYQSAGMVEKALEQYEILSKEYRAAKNYDRLLQVYEMILPHKPGNKAILKDVCILYLRQQRPEKALSAMDRYKASDTDETFKSLYEKARLMLDALIRQRTK
jgi:tetratricopeptide (TPR) repeat protein